MQLDRRCVCCNSSDISFYKEKNHYKTYLCNNCGFIFVYPTPKDDEIYSLYKSMLPQNTKLYSKVIRSKELFYYNIHAINFLFDRIGFEILDYFTKDYFFRSIYQFYSFDNINSKIISIYNKIFRKNIKYERYKYPPTTFLEKLNLLSYYILKPLIEYSEKHGYGSELVIIGRWSKHDF